MSDVAKHAGVSMKTVSRVVNNESSVKKNTYEKVQQSIKALNYRPNSFARSLAGNHSCTIGYIYDNPNAYYVIDMQNGILSECKKNHFELLIHPCNHKAEDLEQQVLSLVNHSKVAGIILTPPFSEMPDLLNIIEKINLPVVRVISAHQSPEMNDNCIVVNDYQASYNITEYLIKLGHQDIGFLCGGNEHGSSRERLNGFQSALLAHGIVIPSKRVVQGEYSFDSGVQGAKLLLSEDNPPTAIFASNDEIAAGALFSARLMGIDVPTELAITGFEDSPFSRQTHPQLTTAHQPNYSIAEHATKLLIAKIQQRANEYIENLEILQEIVPALVIRGSTDQI